MALPGTVVSVLIVFSFFAYKLSIVDLKDLTELNNLIESSTDI